MQANNFLEYLLENYSRYPSRCEGVKNYANRVEKLQSLGRSTALAPEVQLSTGYRHVIGLSQKVCQVKSTSKPRAVERPKDCSFSTRLA